MTRQEHLHWAKERALEYVAQGDLENAVTSMLSDLDKHEETRELAQTEAMNIQMFDMMMWPRADKVRRFIEDFR